MRHLSVIVFFLFSVSTASAGFADFNLGNWSLGPKKGRAVTPADPATFSADLTSTAKVLTPTTGTGPATFTGGGQWVADYQGVLQFVASSNPVIPGSRIAANVCYDALADSTPIAGIKGVLLEPASTNLLRRSQEFDSATVWFGGTTIAVDSIVAPDGTTTADVIDIPSTGLYQQASTVTGVYTPSIWMKSDAPVQVKLGSRQFAGNTDTTVNVTTVWQRFTAPLSGSGGLFLTLRSVSGTARVHLWGAQVEAGDFASSYIPTGSNTVTRAAAVLSYPVANLRANNLTGTADWTPSMTSATVRWLWGAYKDASNYYGVFRDGTAGTLVFRKRVGGVNYDASYTIAVTPGTTYKVGWRMGAAGVDIFVNGVKGTGNANATDAAVPVAWQIGADGNSGNQGAPQLKNLRIWWEDATDAKMITRTQ